MSAAPDFQTPSGEVLRALVDEFVLRFLQRTLLFSAACLVVGATAMANLGATAAWWTTAAALFAALGACWWLASIGRVRLGAQLYPTISTLGLLASATIATPNLPLPWMGLALVAMLTATAFLLPARQVYLAVLAGELALIAAAATAMQRGASFEQVMPTPIAAGVMAALVVAAVRYFVRHHIEALQMLQARMDDVEDVMATASRIADGDLDVDVDGNSVVAVTVGRMLESLRLLVAAMVEQIDALASATGDISRLARRQEGQAASQAAAVDEVQRTLTALVRSSNRVSDATETVFAAVRESRDNNELIAQRLTALQQQASRIDELAQLIKAVASRSELLALNAALEGVRAGEAGRSFGLVANEMQRHAEDVSQSVADVRQLVEDIDRATEAAVEASGRGTELAAGATEAATLIRGLSRTQLESAAQASTSMLEIGAAAAQVNDGSRDTLEATQRLETLSKSLHKVLEAYRDQDE